MTIKMFSIQLRVISLHTSPEVLGTIVDMPFRFCIAKGDIKPGTKSRATQNMCVYDIIQPTKGYFPDVFDDAVKLIEEEMSDFDSSREDCALCLECIMETKEFMPPLHFTHQTMEKLARMKIDVDIDLYEEYFPD